MNITFKWVGGATWILKIDDIRIACDPVLCPKGTIQDYKFFKSKRLNDPVFDGSDFNNINIWLLTHKHEDHFDIFGFDEIKNDSQIISHGSFKKFFKNKNNFDVKFLERQESVEFLLNELNIKITAMPAIHAGKKIFSGLIGKGSGYLLEIRKKDLRYNIYITGDSVFKKNIKNYFNNLNIDLIVANAGSAMIGKSFISTIIGRITNNINDIIKLNAELNPKILIPVHWGTFSHYYETIDKESIKEYESINLLKVGECIKLK